MFVYIYTLTWQLSMIFCGALFLDKTTSTCTMSISFSDWHCHIPRFVVDDIPMATLICLGCDTLWIDLWLWDFKHYIYMQWWCCWWWWWRQWWRWRWWRRLQSQRTLRNDDHNDFIQKEQHPNRFTNNINSCNYNNSNDNRNSNSNSSNENYNSNSR